jgi:arsenate reductase-like glutaredoxin family protein
MVKVHCDEGVVDASHPPDRTTLESLIQRMGIRAREVLRQKGTPYDDLGLRADHWTDAQLVDGLCRKR